MEYAKLKELGITEPYRVVSYQEYLGGFEAELRIPTTTKEEILAWMEGFMRVTKTTYRTLKTYPNTSASKVCLNLFRRDWRCHHNTRHKSITMRDSIKDTHCPATIFTIVKRPPSKRSKLTDVHAAEGYLGIVKIKHRHNHDLTGAAALRVRDVAPETKLRLLELFRLGYNPTQALSELKSELEEERGEEYDIAMADRSVCPDVSFCYRLHAKVFKDTYRDKDSEGMISSIRRLITNYNNKGGEISAAVEELPENHVVIAIMTPLMRRISQLRPSSADTVFIDWSRVMGRKNWRVFFILTDSPTGGLPVGCFITSLDSESAIAAGLGLYNTLVDDRCFSGRGGRGPGLIVTDDCPALRGALRTVYAEAVPLLSIFHILQATWRWLWDSKNGVKKPQRQECLRQVRSLIRAESEDEVERICESIITDNKLEKFVAYVGRMYERRAEWCLSYCTGLERHENDANNYADATIQVMKENILRRPKATNIAQLLDFVLKKFDEYHYYKLIDAANGCLSNATLQRSYPEMPHDLPAAIVQTGQWLFEVKSFTKDPTVYTVDMSLAICSCRLGRDGSPCKHQDAVLRRYPQLENHAFLPVINSRMRQELHHIATGKNQPESYFTSVQDIIETPFSPMSAGSLNGIYVDDIESSQNSSHNLPSHTQDDIDAAQEKIMNFAQRLCTCVHERPEIYFDTVNKFTDAAAEITSDSTMVAALSSFGTSTATVSPKR